MLSISGGQRRGFGPAAALAAASALVMAAPTQAAAPGWLRKAFAVHFPSREKTPPVARFSIDSGGQFTLDRSTPHPVIKFDDSSEVWALSVSRGPRGDLLYWNDLGQPILRITRLGGVTVFTARRPGGAAASLEGVGSPVRLRTIGWQALGQRLYASSQRASHAVGRLIVFEAPEADASNDGLIADAALLAADAVTEVAVRPGGRTLLARFAKVTVIATRQVSVAFHEPTLLITVDPTEGLAGRPSSLRMQEALGARPVLSPPTGPAALLIGLKP